VWCKLNDDPDSPLTPFDASMVIKVHVAVDSAQEDDDADDSIEDAEENDGPHDESGGVSEMDLDTDDDIGDQNHDDDMTDCDSELSPTELSDSDAENGAVPDGGKENIASPTTPFKPVSNRHQTPTPSSAKKQTGGTPNKLPSSQRSRSLLDYFPKRALENDVVTPTPVKKQKSHPTASDNESDAESDDELDGDGNDTSDQENSESDYENPLANTSATSKLDSPHTNFVKWSERFYQITNCVTDDAMVGFMRQMLKQKPSSAIDLFFEFITGRPWIGSNEARLLHVSKTYKECNPHQQSSLVVAVRCAIHCLIYNTYQDAVESLTYLISFMLLTVRPQEGEKKGTQRLQKIVKEHSGTAMFYRPKLPSLMDITGPGLLLVPSIKWSAFKQLSVPESNDFLASLYAHSWSRFQVDHIRTLFARANKE
jgi:hypothetical protein